MGGFCISNVAVVVVFFLLTITIQVQGQYPKKEGCDIYKGSWVHDGSYPLYDPLQCPFLESREFDCQRNGRPDIDYLQYRWQPTSCNLTRTHGQEFLLRFKGKRIMFVGDSLSLNQWQSLTCMLHTAVPHANYITKRIGGLSHFIFPAYNISIMFFRNAFLVDIKSQKIGRVLNLDSLETSEMWKGIDVLIFNSWHWWLHSGRQQPWDFIQEGQMIYRDMNRLVAYQKALNTWARWVESNIDPTKTKVIFQVFPQIMPGSGAEAEAKSCFGARRPLPGPVVSHPAQIVLEGVLSGMSKAVYLLNITGLSQLRIDGHPSAYGYGGNISMDCSHWCLPGVPDIWNQLLYAYLLQD